MSENSITFGRVLKLNLQLAGAMGLGAIGCGLWQIEGKEWWGFHLLAILLGVAAAIMTIQSLNEISKMIFRDWKIGRFTDSARQPRDDRFADRRDMDNRGMFR